MSLQWHYFILFYYRAFFVFVLMIADVAIVCFCLLFLSVKEIWAPVWVVEKKNQLKVGKNQSWGWVGREQGLFEQMSKEDERTWARERKSAERNETYFKRRKETFFTEESIDFWNINLELDTEILCWRIMLALTSHEKRGWEIVQRGVFMIKESGKGLARAALELLYI